MGTMLQPRRGFCIPALALAALCSAGVPAVHASDALMDDTQLVQLSRSASTPHQHARAAKQYRLRAEILAAQADQAEAAAARTSPHQPPITYKFPTAFGKTREKNKQYAIQTRRAAQEARKLEHWHLSRAVELLLGQ